MEKIKQQIKLNAENKLYREMIVLYDKALKKPTSKEDEFKIFEKIKLEKELQKQQEEEKEHQRKLLLIEEAKKTEQYKLMLKKANHDKAVNEIVMQIRLRQKKRKVLRLIQEVKRIGLY